MPKTLQPRNTKGALAKLRARLAEAEETLNAIRGGEVDAIAVDGPHGRQIFTLQTADQPYRILAERMNEGAATLTAEGTILFCNPRLAEMVGIPTERLLGSSFISRLREEERRAFAELARSALKTDERVEGHLLRSDGTILPVQLSLSSIPLDVSGQGICLVATDLSGQKQVQQKLREQAALLDLAHDAVLYRSLDGRTLFWSRGARDLYGWTAEEAVGKSSHDLLQTRFPEPMEAIQAAIQETREWEGELHHTSREGKAIVVTSRWSLLRDEQGKPTAILEINRDITERKRAQERLREASLYTRSLIEASLDPLVTIRKDGRIMDVNRATELATGISREKLIGSDFCDYFSEPEKARQGYEQVFAEGSVRDYPLAIRSMTGKVTEVLYNATVFKNEAGEVAGVFAAARDVTERKRAEEELRLSRERLALAQKAAHSGTFDWDIQNNVNRWSAEVEEVYGIAPGGFGGTYEDWEALVVPEDLVTAKQAIQESLKCGEFASEWRIRRRNDGEIRWITARARVLFDEAGRPIRMLGLNMDITERKQAEEEVRRLNNELEERVMQRTAQLEAANKELEAFTYSVSHDLRAPLRHISGFSQILTEEYGPSLVPEAQHHLQRIQEGTRRMGLLVDDLLNLGRVGRHEVRLQVTGLNSVVNEVIAELQVDCEGRQVEWKLGGLPFVECDPALMKQVFQNLISNAVKFTRPRSQAVIEVGQKDRDGMPAVFVRDNGVGFNMKYSDKLFGVFQRLHRPEDFEGTGVGLATVQRIVQKHGGRIWAEAELDKGATFYFTLGASEKSELKTETAMVGDAA